MQEIDEDHFFRTVCWRLYDISDLRRLRFKLTWYLTRRGRQRLQIAKQVLAQRGGMTNV